MEARSTFLQNLLLDIFSTCRPVDAASVAALSTQDWEAWLDLARQHRLLPMLHWRLTRERADLPVPPKVSEVLAANFKRWTLRALLIQRELLLTHRVLNDAGIPHLALKGAYLAFHAYPHPALRPMRDLDILVPKEAVLRAYQVLLDAGFVRPKQHLGDLDATMQVFNHLPPLHSASGHVHIELHARFSNPDEEGGGADLADDDGLWQRAISLPTAGGTLSYLAPTDLLLHLIEHAVYSHRFDNGPLVLSDLAYLLAGQAIDWPLFWQRAEAYGQRRGMLLLLKMVERYFGAQPIDWPEAARADLGTVDAMADTASLLTLRDVVTRADTRLDSDIRNQSTMLGKLGVFFGKAFPPKKKVAALYPVQVDSPLIYFWYVAKWWKMLAVRLPAYMVSRREERTAREAQDIVQLEQWLDERPRAPDTR